MHKRNAKHVTVIRIIYIIIILCQPFYFIGILRHLEFLIMNHLRIEFRLNGKVAKIIHRFSQHIATMFCIRSHLRHNKIGLTECCPF